ncbi:MAG: hypothetical protein KDD03_13260 [Gelidibacter sp.]|nr:hypothetical protein [Gelidibacter sp.]
MTIYSEDYFKPDWNEIIKDFSKVQTKIWNKDLMCANIIKINEKFNDCIYRDAPNEAQELLYRLQNLV